MFTGSLCTEQVGKLNGFLRSVLPERRVLKAVMLVKLLTPLKLKGADNTS
jgi:hypothetical protein